MLHDDFGDRMKAYEGAEANRRLDPTLPMVARLDGRVFSKFTRGFVKPFDDTLTRAMDQATKALVDETHANIGYTQSDEITLIWDAVEETGQRFFDDRIQKLCSVLASKCTIEFAFAMMEQLNARGDYRVQVRKPHFDCRIWNVPTQGEAVNTLCGAHKMHAATVSVYFVNNMFRTRLCKVPTKPRCLNWHMQTAHLTSTKHAHQENCLDVTSNVSRVSVNWPHRCWHASPMTNNLSPDKRSLGQPWNRSTSTISDTSATKKSGKRWCSNEYR